MLDRFDFTDGPGKEYFFNALEAEKAGDTKKCISYYNGAVDQGNVEAMVNLGVILADGDADDRVRSIELFRNAADRGSSSGFRNLAYCKAIGLNTEQDKTEAVRLYKIAGNMGNVKALCNVGVMYRYGNGVIKDDAEAARWYRRSADAGYFRAQASLAELYLKGEGVEADPKEAFRLYSMAADQDSNRGMYNLALMLFDGIGCEKDAVTAEQYIDKAVSQKYAKAYFVKGDLLEKRGDTDDAVSMYNEGAKKKEPRCIEALQRLGLEVPEYVPRTFRKRKA